MTKRLRVLLFETPKDPYYNLALEEVLFLLHSKGIIKDDVLRIWRNENAVVIGYFQSPAEEVDLEYADKIKAIIVRRFTGGGAVYHDLGNINYAVITRGKTSSVREIYEYLLGGILEALSMLGLNPWKENINDIVANNRKVSGTAASIKNSTLFLHGSLLVSTDLVKLSRVLKVSRKKLMDKGVSSVKYRVALLEDLLGRRIEYWEIIDAIVKGYSALLGSKPYYDLPTKLEVLVADKLYYGKYLKHEWNFERKSSHYFRDVYREIDELLKTTSF